MPKVLNELLMLVDSYQEFESLAKVSKRKERKNYYLILQKQTLELISAATNIIGISIGNPKEFYHQINVYYEKRKNKEKIFPIEDLITDESQIEKIILLCQNFDKLSYQNEQRKSYFTFVSSKPLYKKIIGLIAEDKKEELEKRIAIPINFESRESDIYQIANISNEWKNALEKAKKEGRITEEEYSNHMAQIDYLTNYYFSIINGEQGKFEEEIKREMSKKQ